MIIFSVRMIKLCINTVAHLLTLIFQNSIAAGTFPTQWKRANIVSIHKKNDKQIVSNYRPVSLLPLCSKIFEKLIFNELFKFFLRAIYSAYLRVPPPNIKCSFSNVKCRFCPLFRFKIRTF